MRPTTRNISWVYTDQIPPKRTRGLRRKKQMSSLHSRAGQSIISRNWFVVVFDDFTILIDLNTGVKNCPENSWNRGDRGELFFGPVKKRRDWRSPFPWSQGMLTISLFNRKTFLRSPTCRVKVLKISPHFLLHEIAPLPACSFFLSNAILHNILSEDGSASFCLLRTSN